MGTHLDDARIEMPIVGDQTALRTGEGNRVDTARLYCDRKQRHRDALARRHQHVEFPARRFAFNLVVGLRSLFCQGEQAIRGLAHRAHHDHHRVTGATSCDNPVRDVTEMFYIGERRAAVFLDDDRTGGQGPPSLTQHDRGWAV